MKPNRSIVCPWAQPIDPRLSQETTVVRRQLEVSNRLGLHLRTADQLVGARKRTNVKQENWHWSNADSE